MYEGRLELSPILFTKKKQKFKLHILFSANIFEHVLSTNWLQAMERLGLYNIYSSHWDTPEMCKPSVPGVLQRRKLEVTTYTVCALCGTLLELFMIDLAWYMDSDTCMAQIFVCGRNSNVLRFCFAPYSKLRVIAQHL